MLSFAFYSRTLSNSLQIHAIQHHLQRLRLHQPAFTPIHTHHRSTGRGWVQTMTTPRGGGGGATLEPVYIRYYVLYTDFDMNVTDEISNRFIYDSEENGRRVIVFPKTWMCRKPPRVKDLSEASREECRLGAQVLIRLGAGAFRCCSMLFALKSCGGTG